MKAILIEEHTKRLYIGTAPNPVCGEDDLIVRVKATSLNRADLLQREGNYPPPKGASEILGLEIAGIVEQVGNRVTDWEIGDRVFALLPGGGYAEKVVVPGKMALKIPDSLSFSEAAAIPEAFLTAYLNLVLLGELKEKEFVLIHAGASGVGTAAIQIAKEIGATIIVTAGSKEKLDYCLNLGADFAINYKDGDFSDKMMEITQNHGVDLILDFVGASFWQYNLDSISIDGRWILIGTLGGSEVNHVNIGLFLSKRIKYMGSTLRSRTPEFKIELTQAFKQFGIKGLEIGTIKPVIDKVYNWTDVEKAHMRMKENRNIGKIVLEID
ncbi:NAD(P)H-quinone oxidoreductase [Paucisalibacillus globulus]|uniref:NAD(P)H-quinone oxidoreductase n=1 Tax=Paucisalibacillus globulus TaxID=351095 RepID=UPI0004132178|nr:NAD(P)H-quinone oxidoreductase [Paucisalibacillus globulus]